MSFNLRSLPLWIMLSGFFFINCGANMVIPFFGIYLTTYMHLSPVEAGLVLTVTVGTPRAMALFGGSAADRFGIRRSMLCGLAILIVSAFGYAFSQSLWAFVLCSFFTGIGYSLFTPAGKAAVARLTAEQSRVLAFSLRNMAVNIGAAVGPVVGMLITVESLRKTFLLTSLVYFAFLVLVWLFLRMDEGVPPASVPLAVIKNLVYVFRDKRLLVFSVLIIAFYVMLAQFSLVLPLFAADRFAAQDAIGMLFAGNALLMIAAQYPLLAVCSRYLAARHIAFVGVLLAAAGIGSAAFAGHFAYLVAVTLVIFTIGQLLIMPSIDTVVADMAPDGLAASYQGFSGLAAAAGGILGNTAGGALYGWAKVSGWIQHVWGLYFAAGLLCCLLYAVLQRTANR
ncbi:MDR family MFS transporter [Paenibacillus hamazuiensis]|uniref:MDR family MFS transporter n=1 Tax=Paenibacillus hamazuiensis TaxID=2936508 RepID=UPI00200CED5F|nr:MFS transporter [Paenibacillus hamazuiensis]